MRPLILVPLLLLPLAACMTQRDSSIWQEFKAEISGEKAADDAQKVDEVKAEPATPPADEAAASEVKTEAAAPAEEASETVQVPEK